MELSKTDIELSNNVTILEKGSKKYYIVGTAHVSPKSVEEVGYVIDAIKPDTVCVELCKTRYDALTEDSQWRKLNIVQVLKQGKALMLLASLALSSFQRKMGDKMGVKPGAELLEGVKKAEEVGAKLVLADRDIQVTLKRTWANLSFFKKLKILLYLLESVISSHDMSEEDLEQMKESEQITDMMEEFAKEMPEVKVPLIDERDIFLMAKIEEAEGDTVVAIVGAGHVAGMKTHFQKEKDHEAVNVIPPPSLLFQSLKWIIPLLVLALFGFGYYKHQGEGFEQMLWAWILPNSILAGLFTIIGGARIPTIVSAFFAAPLTSLNPAIGAGMVAGLVEALVRKPTVADCERIPDDIQSIKGFYKNPFTRVLLIFMLANLGSSLGTYIGVTWLVTLAT